MAVEPSMNEAGICIFSNAYLYQLSSRNDDIVIKHHRFIFSDYMIASAISGNDIHHSDRLNISDVSDGDDVIIFAHAQMPSCLKRSDFGGLMWLEEQLAHGMLSKRCGIVVIGFLPPDSYGRYSYILSSPCITYYTLPDRVNAFIPIEVPPLNDFLRLALQAAEGQVEVTFSTERHAFRSLAAVARLVFGAILFSYPFFKRPNEAAAMKIDNWFRNQLLIFSKNANNYLAGEGYISTNIDSIMSALDNHRRIIATIEEKGFQLPEHYNRKGFPGLNIILMDDHHRDGLWDFFGAMICKQGRFLAAASWGDLKSVIKTTSEISDLSEWIFIIDCNLGDNHPVGIQVIKTLRHTYPELRVFMMSAFDDAQVALLATRTGANGYFVKELNDRSDRSSLDYYLRFLQLIEGDECLRQPSAKLRKLWLKFAQRFTETGECRSAIRLYPNGATVPMIQVIPAMLYEQIKLAFYLAFTALEHESWISHGGNERPQYLSFSPSAFITALSIGWKRGGPKSWKETRSIVATSRHSLSSDRIGWDEALIVLEECLDRLEPLTERSKLNDDCDDLPIFSPYNILQLQSDSIFPGCIDNVRSIAHDETNGRAARELLSGSILTEETQAGDICHSFSSINEMSDDQLVELASRTKRSSKSYYNVIIIDDELPGSLWHRALTTMFPGVQYITPCAWLNMGNTEQKSLLEEASLVLVDLVIDGLDTGLDIVDSILTTSAHTCPKTLLS